MHPVVLQQRGAEPITDIITNTPILRSARQARCVWRSRVSRQTIRPALPRTQAETERPPSPARGL